jgi:hypothetical protein
VAAVDSFVGGRMEKLRLAIVSRKAVASGAAASRAKS